MCVCVRVCVHVWDTNGSSGRNFRLQCFWRPRIVSVWWRLLMVVMVVVVKMRQLTCVFGLLIRFICTRLADRLNQTRLVARHYSKESP